MTAEQWVHVLEIGGAVAAVMIFAGFIYWLVQDIVAVIRGRE